MKMNSFTDSIAFFLAKGLSRLFSFLPLRLCLWIGRRAGDLGYLFYRKRGEVAYTNLKSCLGERLRPKELLRLERKVFQNLIQSAVEILQFPKIDKSYLDRYVTIRGLERLAQAKKKGKGAIALTAHFGNWELQSFASALRGYPSQVLAREQKFQKTNALLNRYRERTGCQVIHKGFMTREILRALKKNQLVGILTDQDAGKKGVFVNFFGRPTSFARGPIAFALKTGCEVIPCFIRRKNNLFHVIDITEPLNITKSGNEREDIQRGLQQFANRLEEYIRSYPDQWLWLHKRWKSSPTRKIAVLSDGKAGHLNQSLGVASLLENVLKEEGKEVASLERLEVRYRQKWRRVFLTAWSLLPNRWRLGNLLSLRFCLTKECYERLIRTRYDFIISAGSSLAPVNRILSLENAARAVVVMDPVLPPARFFDLAIIPEHDHPPASPKVVATTGAPHRLTEALLEEEGKRLSERIGKLERPSLGLLIGGRTREFQWQKEELTDCIDAVVQEAEARDLDLLVTTSRRSSKELEDFLESSLKNHPRCKLLVLANRMNWDGVVPGILCLSKVAIVTGESLSMVSEAIAASDRVIVLLPSRRRRRSKIERALLALARKNQIVLAEKDRFGEALEKALQTEL